MQPAPIKPVPLQSRRSAAGFTLAEVLVSVLLTGMLMLALTSAMLLAGRAIPDSEDPLLNTALSNAALEQLLADCGDAIQIIQPTSTRITITVADRDNDGEDEIIQYEWSGEAGDPLFRRLNTNNRAAILERVNHLAFALETVTHEKPLPGVFATGAETRLFAFTPADTDLDLEVGGAQMIAQWLQPDIPAAAAYWTPTRLMIQSRQIELLDRPGVRLAAPNHRTEPGETICQGQVDGLSLLDVLGWHALRFDKAGWLDVNTPVYVEMAANAGRLQVAAVEGGNVPALRSSDSGASWQPADQTMVHELYGKAITAGPTRSWTTRTYQRLRVTLTPAGATDTTLHTAVALLNRPPVAVQIWSARFQSDPTRQDNNGDGPVDWIVPGNDVFDAAALANGLWSVGQSLRTHPSLPIQLPTTLHMVVRDTTAGDDGLAMLALTGGSGAPPGLFSIHLRRIDTETQRIELRTVDADGAVTAYAPAITVSSKFFAITLRIFPVARAVNLEINGVNHGTFPYNRANNDPGYRGFMLIPAGDGAVVDRVRATVWEASS